MKQIIILIGSFLTLCFTLHAQKWVELGASGTNPLNANGVIHTVTVDSSNVVYAAGEFTKGGYYYVAKYDGNSWSSLGSGVNALNANGIIRTLAVDKYGKIYAGGEFRNANSKYYIAVWNGTNWSEMSGSQSNWKIGKIVIDYKGENLYTVLYDPLQNSNNPVLGKWDGVNWTRIVTTDNFSWGSKFLGVGGLGNIFYCNGDSDGLYKLKDTYRGPYMDRIPATVPTFANSTVYAMVVNKEGYAFVAGSLNGSNGNMIIKWDGTTKSILGDGRIFSTSCCGIKSLALDRSGNLYAFDGYTTSAGRCVTKFDGTNWTRICAKDYPLDIKSSSLSSMVVDGNENIYMAGFVKNSLGYYVVVQYSNLTTDILNEQNQNPITISPNPGSGIVNVPAFAEDVEVKVCNMLGQVIYSQVITSGTTSIDFTLLHPGIHTVLFNGASTSYLPIKWVKE